MSVAWTKCWPLGTCGESSDGKVVAERTSVGDPTAEARMGGAASLRPSSPVLKCGTNYSGFGRECLKRILVTGSNGFTGCNFLRLMIPERPKTQWANLDP